MSMLTSEDQDIGAALGRAAKRAERAARGGGPGDGEDSAAAAHKLAERMAGEGLADISYAELDSPFGPLLAATTSRGLVRLAFPEESVEDVLERLALRLSPRIVEASTPVEPLRRELEDYFDGRRRSFELALDWSLIGPFGRRVLGVTAAIPYGGVLSYAEVAAEAGSPRGSRAAGNALGVQPDPDRDPLPPRAAKRRRARRLRRRPRPQALPARARGRRPLSSRGRLARARRTARTRPRRPIAAPRGRWSAGSPIGMPFGAGMPGVSRRYHSASSAAWQPEPAAVIAWR